MGEAMPPDSQGAQVLIKLGEISERVAVVQTKQDGLKDQIDRLPLADYETRLRSLEKFRYMVAGASLLGGAVAGWIASALSAHVH